MINAVVNVKESAGRMKVVERAERSVVGIEVVADFADLRTEVPAAWTALFSRRNELSAPADGSFVEVSEELGAGRYREVVGVTTARPTTAPEGMCAVTAPAGRYLSHRHDGAIGDITEGFAAMYAWAADNGVPLGRWKVDSGYQPGFSHTSHDLLIDIIE